MTTSDPRGVTCWDCRDHEDVQSAMELVDYLDRLPEEREPGRDLISILRQVHHGKGAMKVDGVLVDVFTASTVIAVYDALSPTSQARMAAMPLQQMASVAFKVVNNARGRS